MGHGAGGPEDQLVVRKGVTTEVHHNPVEVHAAARADDRPIGRDPVPDAGRGTGERLKVGLRRGSPPLERAVAPQAEEIAQAVRTTIGYRGRTTSASGA